MTGSPRKRARRQAKGLTAKGKGGKARNMVTWVHDAIPDWRRMPVSQRALLCVLECYGDLEEALEANGLDYGELKRSPTYGGFMKAVETYEAESCLGWYEPAIGEMLKPLTPGDVMAVLMLEETLRGGVRMLIKGEFDAEAIRLLREAGFLDPLRRESDASLGDGERGGDADRGKTGIPTPPRASE